MKRLLLLFPLLLGFSHAEGTSIVARGGTFFSMSACKDKTASCPQNRKAKDKKYAGMKGELTSLEPVLEEYGANVFEIKMADGSLLYYSDSLGDIFGNYGLIKLQDHENRIGRAGQPVIEGSSITIDDVFLDSDGIGYKYVLSTGNEIWGDSFANLEKLLPLIPQDKQLAFLEMLDEITIKYDDMEDVFFVSINESKLRDTNQSNILPIRPYIAIKNGVPLLRIVFHYEGSGWLFVEKILVKVDDQRVSFEGMDFNRSNSSYTVWETHDKVSGEEGVGLINSIIAGKDINVRFYGKQSYSDRAISSKHQRLISNIKEIDSMFK